MEKQEGINRHPQEKEIKEGVAELVIKERMDELLELIEIGFFEVGNRYGVEQFFPDPTEWDSLKEKEQQDFLKALGSYLDVDLLNITNDKVVRSYKEPGVSGQPSESGADVRVLITKLPELEIHVMEYKNPKLGVRYDLVRKEVNK
ncbi:hypothetical protein COT64_03605 [Candidatus Shapirobacteria bacterium CG09_land_8_20_14_0_10_39_12]|uniref:Uncharacterized protein n=1 Tax=Candidatus Shapirobacteria bacterium CG09_land_8_20_14_0_10_39_12 TaxID=1974885 RepID=A0A2H0WNN7_9BACT|nr:MAG: hypothetical protein COT64_03605 [Candidatus Shapirobacteria bacterium CG09_land_8_20_14_0_10_39_12]